MFGTAASLNLIDGADMRNGTMQVNLSESLGGVPGLQIKDRQNYAQDLQLSIRGFGARSSFGVRGVRLYIDGIPATMPDGQGQTSNIDISSIARLEVLRGPFSALYGNSSGGAIQVFTEAGTAPATLTTSAAVGSYGTNRYGFQASGASDVLDGMKGMDYLLSGTRFITDGYRQHSAARKNLLNAKFGVSLDESSKLTLIMNRVDLSAQDPLGLSRQQFESAPRSSPLAEQYNTRKTVLQTQGGLLAEKRIDGQNSLNATIYAGQRSTAQFQAIPVSAQLSATSPGAVIDLNRNYDGADIRLTHRTSLAGGPLNLAFGLAYDEMFEHRLGYNNFSGSTVNPILGVQGTLRRDEDNVVRNMDQYLQVHWDPSERWTADAGLRHSSIRFFSSDHYVSALNGNDSGASRYETYLPAASLLYRASPVLNLYLSSGRGFETPTLNEIAYRPGNVPGLNFSLKASNSKTTELGLKLKNGQGLMTAALFQTETANEIVTDSNSGGRTTYRNGGRTLRQGLELGWQQHIAPDWDVRAAYSWLDATYRDTVCSPSPCSSVNQGIATGSRLPGVARQTLFGSLNWAPLQGWRGSLEARYVGNVVADDRNTDTAAGYFLASLSLGYHYARQHWSLKAFVRADNLFDRKYAGSVIVNEANGRFFEPAPGRNSSIGTTVAYSF
ncbi:TonB-dependent receptor [Undibacterium terreum]|uniref:TonB-dependent receptor n=1 Tax=Undibacterium terreum TaxID=1224302 RepID=A0A916XDZ9_9BURK|nr:TonB-dependent receptor [Undibacterium terreum]